MLKKKKKNLCDGCDQSTTTGTCSNSYIIEDGRKQETACRCNPHEFAFRNKERPQKKCGKHGCPDREDGYGRGTCHNSHPWYDEEKFDSVDMRARCKYPLEKVKDLTFADRGFAVTQPNADLSDVFS